MERLLIVKVKRTSPTQAELYAARHKYPDLKLFDLGELAAVGLDPSALTIGQETPARFWAVYELSDKLNQKGNAYKDVIALEPIGGPATTTSAAVSDPAILAELRAIRALLAAMAEAQGLTVPIPQEQEPAEGDGNGHTDLDAAFPRYGDGQAVGDKPAELVAFEQYRAATGQPPATLAELRAWVLAQRKAGNGKH
jgi:hypothetical protein